MNKLRKWSIITAASLRLLSFAQGALVRPGTGAAGGQSVSRIQSVEGVISALTTAITWFQNILLILAVLAVLYAAFIYITARGDEDKVGTAKKALLYAAIGIAIVLLAYSVRPILEQFLQVQ